MGSALTVVCAPAGYGKTTLLAQWMEADGAETPFAWVSLDRGDADPVRFWSYLISALAEQEPSAGRDSLSVLGERQEALTTDAIPLLFDELAQGTQTIMLVLDDYHLAESAGVDDSIAFFIEHRPPRIGLVISTRSDPRLPLGRLRASDRLVEVRAQDLRFDEREGAAFFDRAGIDPISSIDVGRLVERSEGWPAALRLAAILLRSEEDSAAFVQTFAGSNRQIVDYMATDVLQTLPPSTRAFLRDTCVLGRLSGPLCDAVAQIEGSSAILRRLSRANLFITPIDGEGEWYRYHQLFAEALRLELRVSRPDLVAVLHTRASAWFEQEGDLEAATDHAIAARDIELSRRLILRQLQRFVAEGRIATVDRWLEGLSWPAALQAPELATARALATGISGRLEDAEKWLDVAAEGRRDAATEAGIPLGFLVDLLRSFYALRDVSSAHASALRALDEAPTPEWRGAALTGLGQCLYLLGQSVEAAEALHESMQLLEDDPYLLSAAAGYLALAECDRGAPERGERIARRVLALLHSGGFAGMGPTGICHLGLGVALDAQGHVVEGERALGLAVELCRSTSPSLWHAHALVRLADARRGAGNARGAEGSLGEAEAILERLPDPGMVPKLAASLRERLSTPARRRVAFGEELSEREVTVLRLADAGLTQREIADELFVSYNTVKTHLRTIYRKLGVDSRAHALERAKEYGVL